MDTPMGWKCPSCGAGNAAWVARCACVPIPAFVPPAIPWPYQPAPYQPFTRCVACGVLYSGMHLCSTPMGHPNTTYSSLTCGNSI